MGVDPVKQALSPPRLPRNLLLTVHNCPLCFLFRFVLYFKIENRYKRCNCLFSIRVVECPPVWKRTVHSVYLMRLLKKNLISIIFNPFALRKAKIAYNFGLSDCKRVNRQSVQYGQKFAMAFSALHFSHI